jgi:ABC-type glutathione transport system ATPase component
MGGGHGSSHEGEVILEARGLTVSYPPRGGGEGAGVEAVKQVDLILRGGESVGLVGPSGSGKSSLVLALSALLDPSAGGVFFEGVALDHLDRGRMLRFRRSVQPVLQATVGPLNPRQRIRSAVREPMRVHGVDPSIHGVDSVDEAVDLLLDRVGLSPDMGDRLPGQLSGGERRRVAIARALALKPKVLLLDEPVSAVDVSVQAGILRTLEDLRSRAGLAYLLVSHDLGVVSQVCERVHVMLDGSVVEAGPSGILFSAPLHPLTGLLTRSRGFVDNRDSSPARVEAPTPVSSAEPVPEGPAFSSGGCPFHSRCLHPGKEERCVVERPGLRRVSGERFVACFGAFSESR